MGNSRTPLSAADKLGYNRMYAGPLGSELNHKRQCVKGIWDFADQGGATGTVNLHDEDGNNIVIPNKAIVTQVYSNVVTAATTSASGTLSFDMNAAGDLKAALAAASYSGIQAGVPTGTAANMVAATADRTLTATIATGALTAGKIECYVEFVYIT